MEDAVNGVPVEACRSLIGAVRDDAQNGQTSWRSVTTWKGGFLCESQIRNHVVHLDEPQALGGTDAAPNMVEAVLAAYGSCLTVGYALNASLRGIRINELEIEVSGGIDLAGFFGISEDVSAGFEQITANVHLEADVPDAELQDLHDHVLKTSPVGSILSRPIAVTTELRLDGRALAA
jgi:uncharacterized OsmC-like protein